MRDDVKDLGYDREQEYFHRKEKELLEKRRLEQDAASAAEEARELKERHWMRCPRCGHQMAEEESASIRALRCSQCAGVYFDASELERIQEAQEAGGVVAGLKRWLGR